MENNQERAGTVEDIRRRDEENEADTDSDKPGGNYGAAVLILTICSFHLILARKPPCSLAPGGP